MQFLTRTATKVCILLHTQYGMENQAMPICIVMPNIDPIISERYTHIHTRTYTYI